MMEVARAALERGGGAERLHAALRVWGWGAAQVVGIVLIGVYLITFAVKNAPLQWDLDSYLLAARAARAGLNPYEVASLELMSGRPVGVPFVYPPIGIVPFLLLAEWPSAATAWMCLKLGLLAASIALWWQVARRRVDVLPLALVAVFGWNGSALWDLRAGNVAIVECALLWSGLACYAIDRRRCFAVFVVLAACFKVWLLCYLLLLVVPSQASRARWRLLGASLAAACAIVVGPLLIGPASGWTGFLTNIPSGSGLGAANPSGYALGMALLDHVALDDPRKNVYGTAIWGVFAVLLLAMSWRRLRELWRRADPRLWVLAAVTLEVLLAPRPMAYGFLRLGPAPLLLAAAAFARPGWSYVIALALAAQGLARSVNQELGGIAAVYSPWLATLALWLVALSVSWTRESKEFA